MRQTATLLLLLCLAGGACRQGSAQIFDKTNPQREIELGRQVAREVEAEYPLSRNAAYRQRVERIGTALVESMPQKAYPYQFKVLAVPDFNAFCLPGGFMYVYEGLLTRLPNDNAVAFVMAHEITHAWHRHWSRIIDKMKPVTIIAVLAGAATGQPDVANLAQALIAASYSREQEDDADRSGEEMAWSAGFDAQGGVIATEEMVKLEKGHSVPEYLSDHPAAKDRLQRLQTQAADLAKRERPKLKVDGPADVDVASLAGKLPAGPYAASRWLPLEVGREWTYAVEAGGARSTYTLSVVSALSTPDGPVYRAETRLGKDVSVPCQILTTAGCVWRRNRPAERSSRWQTDCRLDAQEGQAVACEGATYTLLQPAPVTTPCGTFSDVLGLRRQTGTRTYEMWFARDVGLVKRSCPETGVTETLTAWKRPTR